MVSTRFRREKYALTAFIFRLLDARYVDLPRPGRVLEMVLTNLRNRPLKKSNVDSMSKSIISMYHDLITGSKKFPLIEYRGLFRGELIQTSFDRIKQNSRENTVPSPLTDAPGILALTVGSRSPTLTPVIPDKLELGTMKADRRNHVFSLQLNRRTITRVISTVYSTEETEVSNLWRVTDYSKDGNILMSAHCQFFQMYEDYAQTVRQGKRKRTEESSSQSPPKKCLRL